MNSNEKKLETIDRFSGIGGISYALKNNTKTTLYCEIINELTDFLTYNSYLHNDSDQGVFPEIHQNIINLKELPNADLILAGVPCQGHTSVGNQERMNHPLSRLFFQFLRVLDKSNTPAFFIENVPEFWDLEKKRILNELVKSRDFE
jgi:DNA (cytosine-5)-methyltransferase 1